MKLGIIGASGFIGRSIVKEGLLLKHEIIAISRSGIFEKTNGLTSVHCNVFNTEDLKQTLKHVDIIISAYNPGWSNPKLYEDFMKGSKNIIKVSKEIQKPLVIIGGASSLLLQNGEPLYYKLSGDLKVMVKGAFDLFEEIKKDRSFKWTFISPAQEILPLETREKFKVGEDYLLYNSRGKSQINIIDLAHFVLTQGIDPNNQYKHLTLSNI